MKITVTEATPTVDEIFPTLHYKYILRFAGSQLLKSRLCFMSTNVNFSTFKLHKADDMHHKKQSTILFQGKRGMFCFEQNGYVLFFHNL